MRKGMDIKENVKLLGGLIRQWTSMHRSTGTFMIKGSIACKAVERAEHI